MPRGTPLSQLYVGGGTPTALPAELLDRLLESVLERFAATSAQVHTVECSPESLTDAHLDTLQRRGVERVSMGVQSLSSGILEAVDRDHSADAAIEACRRVVDSGRMLNVDLIYGLPGQKPADLVNDIRVFADAGVHSLTFYNLRVNEKTPIARRLESGDRLDLQALVRWRALIRETTRRLGFEHTRWHTYQRRKVATAHDTVTRFEDRTGAGEQFGIGMSARSRLQNVVYRNHSSFDVYLQRIEEGMSPVEEVMPLDRTEQKLRFVGMTLGDGKPLEYAAYENCFRSPLADDFQATLLRLERAELVVNDGRQVILTESGELVYDLIMRLFYPETIRRWLDDRQDLVRKRFPLAGTASS